MKLIEHWLDKDVIVRDADDVGVPYMYLEDEERYYITKNIWIVDSTPYTIVQSIHDEVNKIVKYVVDKPNHLEKIVDKKIATVILDRPWQISQRQRYDIIIWDDNSYNIVEVNSETPAWMPEYLCQSLFGIEVDELNHFDVPSDTYVLFADDWWEDLINASFIAWQMWCKWIIWIDDLIIEDDWIYAYWEKINNLYSFYPLERLFADEWGDKFWELYLNKSFDVINWPVNLITQSKAFWARVFENKDELESQWINTYIFEQFVPHYSFEEKEWYISKPRLFREWVWIWENIEWSVYQRMVDQKKFYFESYEWDKTWYITLWIYTSKTNVVWTYCRICENNITDYTSYYLPIHKNEENITDYRSLVPSTTSWMM